MNHPYSSTFVRRLSATLLAVVLGHECFAPNGFAQSQESPNPPPPGASTHDKAPARYLAEWLWDGDSHVLSMGTGRLKYIRMADGVMLRTFYRYHPNTVTFSPDGGFLISTGTANGSPGNFKVWKLVDGTLLWQTTTMGSARPVLAYSPDGLMLATTGPGSRLNLWQLRHGGLKWSADLPAAITRVVFADQGRAVVAICTDGAATRFPVR
jgi:WD40 repeat protein